MALKVLNEPLEFMDLNCGRTTESSKQTIETHWPLFNESPTNTSLLFLSLSSNAVALNLAYVTPNTHIFHTNSKTHIQNKTNFFFFVHFFVTLQPKNTYIIKFMKNRKEKRGGLTANYAHELPREVTMVWLPPPIPISKILPTKLLTSQLVRHVGAFLLFI